jgi:hypothetical protein
VCRDFDLNGQGRTVQTEDSQAPSERPGRVLSVEKGPEDAGHDNVTPGRQLFATTPQRRWWNFS